MGGAAPRPNGLTDYGRQTENLRAALDWTFSPGRMSIGVALTAAAVPMWMLLSVASSMPRADVGTLACWRTEYVNRVGARWERQQRANHDHTNDDSPHSVRFLNHPTVAALGAFVARTLPHAKRLTGNELSDFS